MLRTTTQLILCNHKILQVPATWLNSTIPYKPYLGTHWAYADCIIIRFNRQVWFNRFLKTVTLLNRTRTACSPKRTPRTSPRLAATTSARTSAKVFPTQPLPASAETYLQTREDSAYGVITYIHLGTLKYRTNLTIYPGSRYYGNPTISLPDDQSANFRNTELAHFLLTSPIQSTSKYELLYNQLYSYHIPGHPENLANWKVSQLLANMSPKSTLTSSLVALVAIIRVLLESKWVKIRTCQCSRQIVSTIPSTAISRPPISESLGYVCFPQFPTSYLPVNYLYVCMYVPTTDLRPAAHVGAVVLWRCSPALLLRVQEPGQAGGSLRLHEKWRNEQQLSHRAPEGTDQLKDTYIYLQMSLSIHV